MKSGQNVVIKKVKNGFVVTPVPDLTEDPNRLFPDDMIFVCKTCDELMEFLKKHFEPRK